jgi:hypothetical protein
MNIEEKYQKEREKIRLKYWKIFRSLLDEIKEEKRKYLMKKNKIMEKYDNIEDLEVLLENI